MAEMWYYTTEGKQMDPVPMSELKGLIDNGTLKPTDMVWKDGMPCWVRASSMRELFADTAVTPIAPVAGKASPAVDEGDHRASFTPRRATAADDATGPSRRRPEPQKAGSSFGIIAALILGAMLLVGGLGVGVVILILANRTSDGKINPTNLIKGEAKYNVVLAPGASENRKFSFRRGVDYEITVKTQPEMDGLDVDIHLFNAGGREVTREDLPDRDCRLRWVPDADGEYKIEVRNLNQFNRAVQVTCAVLIKEFKEQPIVEKKEPPKEEPLPPDTMEGKGFKDFTIPLKKEEMQKFRVRAGYKASFTFVPPNPAPATDFNIIVVKDNDLNQTIAQDVGPEARASATCTLPTTEIVRVRIVNASGKGGTSKGILNYDVSP